MPLYLSVNCRVFAWVIVRFAVIGFFIFGWLSVVSAQTAPVSFWDISQTFTPSTGFSSNWTQISTSTLYGSGHSLQPTITGHKVVTYVDGGASVHEGFAGLLQHTYIAPDMTGKQGNLLYKINTNSPYDDSRSFYQIIANTIYYTNPSNNTYNVGSITSDVVHDIGFVFNVSSNFTSTSTSGGRLYYTYPIEVSFLVDGNLIHSTSTYYSFQDTQTTPYIQISDLNFNYQSIPRIFPEINEIAFYGALDLSDGAQICENCSKITHLTPEEEHYIVFSGNDSDLSYEYEIGEVDLEDGAEYYITIDVNSMALATSSSCLTYSEKKSFWQTASDWSLMPIQLEEIDCVYASSKTYNQGQVWPSASPVIKWLSIPPADMPVVGDYLVTYRLHKRIVSNSPSWWEFWQDTEYETSVIAMDGYSFAYQRRLTHEELLQMVEEIDNRQAINDAQMKAEQACDLTTFSAKQCIKEITSGLLSIPPYGYITRFITILNNPNTGDGANTDFNNFNLSMPENSPLFGQTISLNLVSPNTFMQNKLSGTTTIFGVSRSYYDHMMFYWDMLWSGIFLLWLIQVILGFNFSGTFQGFSSNLKATLDNSHTLDLRKK